MFADSPHDVIAYHDPAFGVGTDHTRGEQMPTLAIIFKIASALECSTTVLISTR